MSFKLLILSFLLPLFALGQLSNITNTEIVGFTNHLLTYGSYQPAIDFAKSKVFKPDLSASQKDSLLFYIAVGYDKLKKDSLAENYYLSVSDSSALYLRSYFIAAQNCIFRTEFKKANSILKILPTTDNNETNQIRYYLENGTALMIGEKISPITQKQDFLSLKPEFQKELIHLEFLAKKKSGIKKRSPWIAGALSGIIPGLGKVYAGSNAQGLSTFVKVVVLGGLAFENYYRHGIKNPQFWFFGGLTSLYYVSGIYGSVYLPKLNYQEKIDAIHQDAKVSLLSPN